MKIFIDNAYCKAHGTTSCILVSIHAKAFGNGRDWSTPRGWRAYTSKGQTRADQLALNLYTAAAKYLPDMKLRTDMAAAGIAVLYAIFGRPSKWLNLSDSLIKPVKKQQIYLIKQKYFFLL